MVLASPIDRRRKSSPVRYLLRLASRDITPVRLWLLFGFASFVSFLFCVASVITIKQHVHALETVGIDAAPSVIAAHQIKIGVASMDRALTDQLLSPAGKPQGDLLVQDFERDRASVCRELVASAQNITYGPAEQVPIEKIQIALGNFEMQAQSARDFHKAGREPECLDAYRETLKTLREKILPNADALNKANSDVLEETYSREKSASALSRGLVLVLGMVLLCTLLYIHVFLSVRFRRRLNMPLLISMVVLALFVRQLTNNLADSSRGLFVAKEDAYNSVLALLEARASAYLAESAMSRCLLDRSDVQNQLQLSQAYLDRIGALKPGVDGRAILASVKQQLETGQKVNVSGLSGYLADELQNVRFEGEGQAALECFDSFLTYSDVAAKQVQAVKDGDQDQAMFLGQNYDPHGSNVAFLRFDDSLVRALKINQEALTRTVGKARHSLDYVFTASIVIPLALIIATYLGLRPRIQEYQAESYLHNKSKSARRR